MDSLLENVDSMPQPELLHQIYNQPPITHADNQAPVAPVDNQVAPPQPQLETTAPSKSGNYVYIHMYLYTYNSHTLLFNKYLICLLCQQN